MVLYQVFWNDFGLFYTNIFSLEFFLNAGNLWIVWQWNENQKSTNLLNWVTVLVSEVFVLAVVSVELRRTKNKTFFKKFAAWVCMDYGFGLLIGDKKLKIVSHLKKEKNKITGM